MTVEPGYGPEVCVDALKRVQRAVGAVSVEDFEAFGMERRAAGERFPTPYAAADRLGGWIVGCVTAGVIRPDRDALALPLRLAGFTYAEVAVELGVSTQQAWLALHDRDGDAPGSGAERFSVRWGPLVEFEFAEARSSKVAAARVGVSERLARRHLRDVGLGALDLPVSQPQTMSWPEDEMVALLRRFVSEAGEPATLGRLAAWAEETGVRVPSYRTWTVRFGSWRGACEAAGVPSGEATRRFGDAVDAQVCVDGVAAYVGECLAAGVRPTLSGYEQLSSERGWPCRNTVLLRLGSWRDAVASVDAATANAVA